MHHDVLAFVEPHIDVVLAQLVANVEVTRAAPGDRCGVHVPCLGCLNGDDGYQTRYVIGLPLALFHVLLVGLSHVSILDPLFFEIRPVVASEAFDLYAVKPVLRNDKSLWPHCVLPVAAG